MMKRICLIFLTAVIAITSFNINNIYAAVIDEVRFEGNKRIPDTRITPYLIKAGKEFDIKEFNDSIKKLYGTGLFLNIDGDLSVDGDKFVLTYVLEEMPIVGSIIFKGNKEVKSSKLKEDFPFKTGSVLSFSSLEKALSKIKTVYEEENRYGTQVNFRIEPRTVNSVDIYFDIEEKPKAKIYNIYIYGNDNITRDAIISAIPTKERGFWSFITSSGKISQEMMDADRELIRMLYLEKGYAKVSVGHPELVYEEDAPDRASLYFRVQENDQYFVRSVDIMGNEKLSKNELSKYITLKPKDVFNIRKYQEDIAKLTEAYTSIGYAYANVEPVINLDDETKEVDITYKVEESFLVHIGRINIKGNTVTNDRVIRRQIDQMEGALYNSRLIREAKANTMGTGYFENVQIAERNVTKDVVDLDVTVKEQSTGTFSLGAAYSTIDGLLGMVQLSRNNFMGWGHSLSLRAEISQERMDFYFSYTDPWLFDWPVSAGIDLFSLEREWYEYSRRSIGGALRLGHSIIKRRLFMNYRFSVYTVDIFDIQDDASDYVRQQQGMLETHSFSPSIMWNSLDNPMDPTRGNKSQLYFDFAGSFLGGDAQFFKIGAETTQYFPVALNGALGFMLHGEAGYITSIKEGVPLPVDERFRLGGINSVRGYDYGDISPVDKDGHRYGGDAYYQVNAEFIFPIKQDIKLKGVIFVDMGQAVDTKTENYFTKMPLFTAGVGLRWVTPMGPFRIEWGYKLNREAHDTAQPYKFEFSIGGTF